MIDFTSLYGCMGGRGHVGAPVGRGGLTLLAVWSLCSLLPAIPARFQSWLWRLAILKFLVALFWFAPIELPFLASIEPARAEQTVPAISAAARSATPAEVSRIAAVELTSHHASPWLLLPVVWTIGVCWQFSRIRKNWRDAARCS